MINKKFRTGTKLLNCDQLKYVSCAFIPKKDLRALDTCAYYVNS